MVSVQQEPSNKACHVGGAIGCNETDKGPCVLMCLDNRIYITINSNDDSDSLSAFDNCTLSHIISANDTKTFKATVPYVDVAFDDCTDPNISNLNLR